MTIRDRPVADRFRDDRCLSCPPLTHMRVTPQRSDKSHTGTGLPGKSLMPSRLFLQDLYALEILCASERPRRHQETAPDMVRAGPAAFAGSQRRLLPSASKLLQANAYLPE